MSHFCPNCGANQSPDPVIVLGAWEISPSEVFHAGNWINLSASQRIIVHTIASAYPRPVSREVLRSRACGEDTLPKTVDVQLHKIRRKVPDIPIRNEPGRGFYWEIGA